MADKGKQVVIEISSSSDEDEEYEIRNNGPIQMGTFYQFLNVEDEDDNPEKKRIKKKPRLTLGSSFHATDNTRKDDINNPFQPMETVKEAEEDLFLELDYRPAAKVFPEVPMEVVPEEDKATEEDMSPDNSDNVVGEQKSKMKKSSTSVKQG